MSFVEDTAIIFKKNILDRYYAEKGILIYYWLALADSEHRKDKICVSNFPSKCLDTPHNMRSLRKENLYSYTPIEHCNQDKYIGIEFWMELIWKDLNCKPHTKSLLAGWTWSR